jgi:hypothetical protein
MKIGTENKKKTILAAVLGVLAIILVAWQVIPFFFGGSSPAPAIPANPAQTAVATGTTTASPRPTTNRANRNRGRTAAVPLVNTLDPTIRIDLLENAGQQHYKGSGRNIFEAYVAPPPSVNTAANTPLPPVNPGPPPLPAINLKFYGWASKQGQAKRIFLSQGDQIFIASEGDLVANRYKVVQIGNGFVKIEDILNNNTQQIPMT